MGKKGRTREQQEYKDPTGELACSYSPSASVWGGVGAAHRLILWEARLPFVPRQQNLPRRDNASGFPTVLWEPPGMKPPGFSQAKLHWQQTRHRPRSSSK